MCELLDLSLTVLSFVLLQFVCDLICELQNLLLTGCYHVSSHSLCVISYVTCRIHADGVLSSVYLQKVCFICDLQKLSLMAICHLSTYRKYVISCVSCRIHRS